MICAIVATMATAVAVKIPKNLKATKNKITGNKSNKNFILALLKVEAIYINRLKNKTKTNKKTRL
jgi:hypothetical protein